MQVTRNNSREISDNKIAIKYTPLLSLSIHVFLFSNVMSPVLIYNS
jgi:hypothetical protein